MTNTNTLIEEFKKEHTYLDSEGQRWIEEQGAEELMSWFEQALSEVSQDTAQDCYLQCLAVESGEGECALAIKTKFKLRK